MTQARDRASTWLVALLLVAGGGFATLVLASAGKQAGTVEAPTEPNPPPGPPPGPPPVANELQVSVDPRAAKTQPAGGTVTGNVTVLGPPGTFAWLNVSGCSPEVSCWFSAWDGTVPFTSVFFVATSNGTTEGLHRVAVLVQSTTANASTPFDLSVVRRHVVIFQKGDGGLYSETDDAQISAAFPNTNNGTDDSFEVDGHGCLGSNASLACRALIKFPQAFGPNAGQVPLGARIVHATLQLYVHNEGPYEDFYQVSEHWEESTVTWNSFASPGSPRTVGEGGRFLPIVQNASSPRGFVFVDVTPIAERWAKGDPNEGILLAGDSGDRRVYLSSEYFNLPIRPKLTVTYENATMPSGPNMGDVTSGLAPAGTMNALGATGNQGTMTGTLWGTSPGTACPTVQPAPKSGPNSREGPAFPNGEARPRAPPPPPPAGPGNSAGPLRR